eukprot:scaffold5524_cov64-Phaeocystis_antarctica.AAC.2
MAAPHGQAVAVHSARAHLTSARLATEGSRRLKSATLGRCCQVGASPSASRPLCGVVSGCTRAAAAS